MKTNYLCVLKKNMDDLKKNKIFDNFETLGYKVIMKGCPVGPKNEVSVWAACKEKEVIVYSNGCFDKYNNYLKDYFTEEEYNVIKES